MTALLATVALLVLTCGIYPVAVWAVGQVAFKHQVEGSFVTAGGNVVGSKLIGQNFTDKNGEPLPQYFQPRPSAAGNDGYDPAASSSSNLGPANPDFLRSVAGRVNAYRRLNGLSSNVAVPVDAVTASGSGLDPDISIANARLQAPRVAKARGLAISAVLAAVDRHTEARQLGVLGEKVVNVLELNLDLDRKT
ncbi:MAG TPA: K(+)-transporting ATPase subunit C [Acidimicrobiales bacterium]|nr:K(+)-transporting ATPase subunit C [Acidimicrobiales bacterium]